MFADGVLCVGQSAGGTPIHYEVTYGTDVIGILTIPGDEQGDIILGDDPLLVRYTHNNVCYTGDLDTINNRLVLTIL